MARKLSPAQVDLLRAIDGGDWKINPPGFRTAEVLRRRGFISGNWGWTYATVEITPAGRAHLASLDPAPSDVQEDENHG